MRKRSVRKLMSFCCYLVLGASLLFPQFFYSQSEHPSDSAFRLRQQKDFKRAAPLLEKEIKAMKNPYKGLFYLLGETYVQAGNLDKGFEYMERAVQEGTDNIEKFEEDPRLAPLRTDPRWPVFRKHILNVYEHRVKTYYSGLYSGILSLLLVLNVIVFFATREKSYLYYGLLVTASLHINVMMMRPYTHYFTEVLPWMVESRHSPWSFLAYLVISTYLLFFMSLAQLRSSSPRLYKVSVILLACTAICLLAESIFHVHLAPFISIVVFLFCLGGAFTGLRKGQRHLRLYIVASFVMVISACLMFTGLRFGPFHSVHGGMLLYIFILLLAMGDKIRLMRIEKEKAQEKALEVLEHKVQERTAEVVEQKQALQEKQNEIMDSIHYAKRLQEAILPPPEFINSHVPENFVLYIPKDVVAGDFYWAEKQNGKFYIAAADSTGHGVPGALVSVVCSGALNRAVKEFGLTETGAILDKTRELVLETFEKSTNEVQDGMDISLLCIDEKNKSVTWSGAHNPLWYTVNGTLKELKPDKQPVGKADHSKPFTTRVVELVAGATFYLFTDGLADQFGGPDGKKFKYKQLEKLLLSVTQLPMQEQKKRITEMFSEWKGKQEQVDDVCMIGVRTG